MDLLYVYQDGSPVKNAPYTIKFDDGTQSTGQLDEDGIAQLTDVPNGQFTVQYGEDTREFEPQDNTTPNPLYKRITPASAIQMSRAGQTATLDEASNIASQAGDWLWGALQGDFNKDPTTAQIVVGSIISMIPVIDQVMDVRDILANVMLLTDDDKANDSDGWIAFTLTAIGLVPVLGSAVKGVGKVVIKNSGDTIEAAIAVLRKLGKGDPVQYLRKINWQDLGKQAASEVKTFIKGLRDTLHEISTSWQYDLLLPQLAIDGMQATIKQLDEIAPKIDQGVKGAASEIGSRVNKALDEFEPPKSTGIVGKPKKSVANELDAPKGNDLKGVESKKEFNLSNLKVSDIPTFDSGSFNKWFDSRTPEELAEMYKKQALKSKISDGLRGARGNHEFLMVVEAPQWSKWGVNAKQVQNDFAISISALNEGGLAKGWKHSTGLKGSKSPNSKRVHNELQKIIQNSNSLDDYKKNMFSWAEKWIEGGYNGLPEGFHQ